MDELFEKLKKIIADKLDLTDESKIKPESLIREDLGADSLVTYELVYAIEEEWGIKVPEEKANDFTKVSDVLEFIRTQAK